MIADRGESNSKTMSMKAAEDERNDEGEPGVLGDGCHLTPLHPSLVSAQSQLHGNPGALAGFTFDGDLAAEQSGPFSDTGQPELTFFNVF